MKHIALAAAAVLILSVVSCGAVKPEGTVMYKTEPYVRSVTSNSAVIAWETTQPHEGFIRFNEKLTRIKETKTLHVFTATELEPGTEYSFLVNNIKRGSCTTLQTSENSSLTVAVYGNSGGNRETHALIAAELRKRRPDLILHTGGASSSDFSLNEAFLTPLSGVISKTPVLGVPGDLPWQKDFYSFNAGPVHCVFVNTDLSGGDMKKQLKWLKDDLSTDRHPWKIAVLKTPPFAVSAGGVDEQVARLVIPVLYKFGVNMVFAGGSEGYYLRSKPMFDAIGNVMNLIITSGGGQTSTPPANGFVLTGDSSNHLCYLTFRQTSVEGYALNVEGQKVDAFTINKSDLKRDKLKNGASYKDVLTDMTVRKWIKATAIIKGSISANNVVPCVVSVSKSPYPGVTATVDWVRDNTTWNVKPKKESKPLSKTKKTEFEFNLDFWGEVYPVLTPLVTFELGNKTYAADCELILPPFREMHLIEIPAFPTVDGYVTEKERNTLKKSLPFISYAANRNAEVQTEVYAGVFGKSLYFGIVNLEPAMDKMEKGVQDRDGAVWNDNCNEILIGVPGQKELFHFIVNSDGTLYDAKGTDRSWDGNWQGDAAKMQDKWSAEFLIPVKDIGKDLQPGEDMTILINICRNNPIKDEYSQWSRTYGSERNPEYFGKAVILRK